MCRSRAPLLCLAFALLCAPRACRSEWLYFRGGGRAQVPVSRPDGRVVVETATGRYSFAGDDLRAVVPGGCPDRDWPERREAARKAGADAQFAAAWWALENGLIPECVALLRAAHAAHPEHQPTARLVKTLARLDRPCPDPEVGALGRALGVACEVERGPHVVLMHQHDPADARARVDLLERVTTAYYLVLAAHGLDPAVPARRLVAVHLRERRDYLAFLDSQDAHAFRTTLGYYHPVFRAVVTYDARTPADRDDAPAGPARPDSERRRLLSDLDTRARLDGTAAHEMIHLLVTESGLAADPGEFPLWLHEGFAAQFEVVRGGRWAGVGRAHDLRLPDYRALPRHSALETLVRDSGFGHGYRRDLYAESWALVYFLRKTRPREFSAFLDLLRTPTPGAPRSDPGRFEAAFRSAFGDDLRGLGAEWQSFMGGIVTPLEEHDPARAVGRAGPAARPD